MSSIRRCDLGVHQCLTSRHQGQDASTDSGIFTLSEFEFAHIGRLVQVEALIDSEVAISTVVDMYPLELEICGSESSCPSVLVVSYLSLISDDALALACLCVKAVLGTCTIMRCPGPAFGGQVARKRTPPAKKAKGVPGFTPWGTSTSKSCLFSFSSGCFGRWPAPMGASFIVKDRATVTPFNTSLL